MYAKIRNFYLLLLSSLLVLLPHARAGQYEQKCKEASAKAKAECDQAVNQCNAQDGAQSQANRAKSKVPAIEPNSGTLQGQAGDQASRVAAAKAKCEGKQKECENECDSQEKKAEADPDAMKMSEPGKVKSAKGSACVMPLLAAIGELDKGLAGAKAAESAAGDTKDAAKGGGMMPLPIPIPLGGGKDSKSAPPPPPTTAGGLPIDCSLAGASGYTSCNETYVKKCTSDLSSADCNGFSLRYCNLSPTPSAPSTSLVAGQMVTSGQSGEGVGTPYCNQATAHDFCDNHTGRDGCDTCRNYRASQSAACQQAPSACMATNTTANSCPVPEPLLGGTPNPGTLPTTGGTATIVTGLEPGSSIAHIVPLIQSKIRTQSVRGTASAGANGGGGSGAGSGGEGMTNAEKSAVQNSGLKLRSVSAIRGTSNGQPEKSVDVASQYGPTLFNIGSDTYGKLCASGRLHCGAAAGY